MNEPWHAKDVEGPIFGGQATFYLEACDTPLYMKTTFPMILKDSSASQIILAGSHANLHNKFTSNKFDMIWLRPPHLTAPIW